MNTDYRLVMRYALPNEDGTYDLFQVCACEVEGLLLRERMPVDILRQWDIECGKNVLRMGLEAAWAYWLDLKGREDRGLPKKWLLRAVNVRVVMRDGVAIDKVD